MRHIITVEMLAAAACMIATMSISHQNLTANVKDDPTVAEFIARYQDYQSLMHRLDITRYYSMREYHVDYTSDMVGKIVMPRDNLPVDIPGTIVITYLTYFHDYKYVSIDMQTAQIYDTGYTRIYLFQAGEVWHDPFKIDLDIGKINNDFHDYLQQANIELSSLTEEYYSEFTLFMYSVVRPRTP